MISSIVRFSIHYPGVIVALAGSVILSGVYSLSRTSLDIFPDFSPIQVVIQTEAPGLPAELVETLVTQPIENAVTGTAGIKSLRSQSIPGLSVVTAIFRDGSDIYRNRQQVAERLALVARSLPTGVAAPTITPLTSSTSAVLGIGLTSKTRSLMELRTLVDWTIRPHLLGVDGVADVNVFGGDVRQLQIQIDPQKLLRFGFSLADVLAAARKATGVRGAGFVENVNQRIVLLTQGQTQDLEQLGRVAVAYRDGQTITLSDVAKIAEGPAPSISGAAIDGKPGVFLFVQGQYKANTKAVTRSVESALIDLEPLLAAQQVEMHPAMFRPANFIDTAVNNVQQDILIGSALVVVVLFLFLFNVRTAFISATAIPLSLLTAVLALQYFGISLNIMVLAGLAIALGEVVDDAIIDTENIFRRLRENRVAAKPFPAVKVVFNASMEVRTSVVYATFIVALVYVPLLTLSGVGGKLFAPLGLAYICAIMASLAVALTVTPALAYLILSRAALKSEDPPLIRIIKGPYQLALRWIEKRPARTIGTVCVVLAIGIGILPLFSGQFIPPLKEGHYILHMTAVPGTSESETLRIGRQVTKAVAAIPGVKSVAQWVGRAPNGADTAGVHYSEFQVEIGSLPGAEQNRILAQIRKVLATDVKQLFPGLDFAVNPFLIERIEETVAGYASSVVVTLYGPNLDLVDRDGQSVARILASMRGAKDVQIQAPPGTPELNIRLDHARLAAWGLSPVDVLESIQLAYEGIVVGQVYSGNQKTNVAVVLAPEERRSITQVGGLALRNSEGRVVPLKDVADIEQGTGRYKILHEGGKRQQTVTCNVVNRDIEEFEREAKNRIAREAQLAPGDYAVFAGAAEAEAQARRDLIAHSLLAAVGIFVLLYLAFNNLRDLALTLFNLPFALFGGVVVVLATGGWLSVGSLVGFVTLFGITLRNSIMLISHYQRLVAVDGLPWNAETAVRGASERLPSILMTATVTALGLLPLALGSGEPGREIQGPMAAIIVGGLVTSTILNLLILPTILLHFGRFEKINAAHEA